MPNIVTAVLHHRVKFKAKHRLLLYKWKEQLMYMSTFSVTCQINKLYVLNKITSRIHIRAGLFKRGLPMKKWIINGLTFCYEQPKRHYMIHYICHWTKWRNLRASPDVLAKRSMLDGPPDAACIIGSSRTISCSGFGLILSCASLKRTTMFAICLARWPCRSWYLAQLVHILEPVDASTHWRYWST